MTAEQLEKIRWLGRVKRAEKSALDYAEIYRQKKEIVNSMKKEYRICGSASRKNVIEMKIADMLDAEKKMNEKFNEVERITEEVHKAISAIPDERLALVLNARYMLFKTHEQTAEMIGVSVETAKRLHKKALDLLQIDTL